MFLLETVRSAPFKDHGDYRECVFICLGEDHRDRPPRHMSDDQDSRRASSRGIIPRAKIKTVKMTFVIVFGKLLVFCITN